MRNLLARSAGLKDETGTTLIEVLASALVLVITTTGVFAGLDAASSATGQSKHKSVAADIAQQDQERLRTFRSKDLSNYRQTRTLTVRNVPFTIMSKSVWLADASGTTSCTSSSDQASYMQITSTVTWPNMRVKPIVGTSMVAPPNGTFADEGALSVEILDRSGAPVVGTDVDVAPVSGTGRSYQATTSSLGCAYFAHLTAGTYAVSFSTPGKVDSQGVQAVSKQVSVTDDTVTRVSFLYDTAASLNVTFQTVKSAATVPADGEYASVGHSGLAAPGTRVFGSGASATAIAATAIFPFTSAYSVYSGNCAGANPISYGQTAVQVTATPGGSFTATVREPSVKLTLLGVPPPVGTVVKLTAKATGCGGVTTYTTDSQGYVVPAAGTYRDPGVPFGVYDVCAVILGTKRTLTAQNVTDPNGVSLALPLVGLPGSCP